MPQANAVNRTGASALYALAAPLAKPLAVGALLPVDEQWAPWAAQAWRRRAALATDAAQVADLLAATWVQIDGALRPVIGPGGVAALYKRGLFLAVPFHVWLMGPYQTAGRSMDTTALEAAFAAQSQAEAVAAGGLMLLEFYQLLATLISSSLAARLLRTVWG